MAYHEGELEVQQRAGTRELSDRVGRIIGDAVPPAAAAFLRERPFVIVATVSGDVSASLLAGPPGFAGAVSDHLVRLDPNAGHFDRVVADLAVNSDIGLLAIDPATRRRMRVNGRAAIHGHTIEIVTREVYSNCPQYIRVREALPTFDFVRASRTMSLDDAQRAWIETADTFFIASAHPRTGADASHRGGPAGFVRVESPHRLWFPDYSGNNMFNTLGNLAVNPQVALLFVDFASGRTLQVRGDAKIRWDGERCVVVQIREVG